MIPLDVEFKNYLGKMLMGESEESGWLGLLDALREVGCDYQKALREGGWEKRKEAKQNWDDAILTMVNNCETVNKIVIDSNEAYSRFIYEKSR